LVFLASLSATAPLEKSIAVGTVVVAVPEVLVDEVVELVVGVAVVPAFRADLVSALASFVSTFAAAFGALVTFAVVTLGAFGAVGVFAVFGVFVEEAFAGDAPLGPFCAASSGASTRVRTIAVPAAIFTKRMRITSLAKWAMGVPGRTASGDLN
jgi:hypothetical protein